MKKALAQVLMASAMMEGLGAQPSLPTIEHGRTRLTTHLTPKQRKKRVLAKMAKRSRKINYNKNR